MGIKTKHWVLEGNNIWGIFQDRVGSIIKKFFKQLKNVGFRIQPKTELYFKRIVQELVANKELNLHIRPDGSTKYNPQPDFKFVVIEKFLSIENEFALREGLLLKSYFLLKDMGLSDEKAFGLEKSDVVAEYVQLLYYPVLNVELIREKRDGVYHDNIL